MVVVLVRPTCSRVSVWAPIMGVSLGDGGDSGRQVRQCRICPMPPVRRALLWLPRCRAHGGSNVGSEPLDDVAALQRGPGRHFAVGVYPHQDDGQILLSKAKVTAALKGHTVHFFDSETHPLTDPGLRIG